ncbi:MAG TPA: DUF1697 domain-containing protein [Terriglobales bacterium]|jgi:uncharacterized protein (DUF1697 family)
MPVIIALLRGVNVGVHNRMKMDALRDLCQSLGFTDIKTYVQSGNVVFRTKEKDEAKLRGRMEAAIEKKFGFRPDVILRSTAEMREAIAKNPFAKRRGIEPDRLLLTFLAEAPSTEAKKKLAEIKIDPELLYLIGRDLYIYFPEGLARPKLPWMSVVKALKTTGTGRNWNTVEKLLQMAEELEASK